VQQAVAGTACPRILSYQHAIDMLHFVSPPASIARPALACVRQDAVQLKKKKKEKKRKEKPTGKMFISLNLLMDLRIRQGSIGLL
jgi:hypothetical protein